MDSMIKIPELPELSFDEKNHIYRLNGVEIPSVSKLLEPLKDRCYSGISERTLEKAAEKGTSVHTAIEGWIKYGVDDIPERNRSYFDGFLDWWNQYHPIPIASEVRIYHKEKLYGGTVDFLTYIGDQVTLIDFKTTAQLHELNCRVQLEAYSQALKSHGIQIERKHILHLKKNGKWNFPEYQCKDLFALQGVSSLSWLYDAKN